MAGSLFLPFPSARRQKGGGLCARARAPSIGEFWFCPRANPIDLFLNICFDDQKAILLSSSPLLPQICKCFVGGAGMCAVPYPRGLGRWINVKSRMSKRKFIPMGVSLHI